MNPQFCIKVRCIRLVGALKTPKAGALAVVGNPRKPCAALSPTRLVPCDAQKSARLVAALRTALILIVGRAINVSEISKTVVAALPVDVVDEVARPLACHVEPSHAVCAGSHSINADQDVSAVVECTNGGPGLMARAAEAAGKQAGFLIVVKNVAQALRRKIDLSHEALLLLIGQRPASVGSTALASLFYGSSFDLPMGLPVSPQ